MPNEIDIPVSVAAISLKLFVLHSAVKLFRKHLKGKVGLCAWCSGITELEKILNVTKFFAEEHVNALSFHFNGKDHGFIGCVIMDLHAFHHKVSISNVELIPLYGQTLFHYN